MFERRIYITTCFFDVSCELSDCMILIFFSDDKIGNTIEMLNSELLVFGKGKKPTYKLKMSLDKYLAVKRLDKKVHYSRYEQRSMRSNPRACSTSVNSDHLTYPHIQI